MGMRAGGMRGTTKRKDLAITNGTQGWKRGSGSGSIGVNIDTAAVVVYSGGGAVVADDIGVSRGVSFAGKSELTDADGVISRGGSGDGIGGKGRRAGRKGKGGGRDRSDGSDQRR